MGDPRLRAVRTGYRGRRDGARDVGYAIYAVAFVVLIAVIPAVRIVFLTLTTRPVLLALSASGASAATALVAGAALVFIGTVGAVRGPAHYPPFLAFVLMESDLPRFRVLRRPFALSTAWLAFGLAAIGAIPGIALTFGKEIELQRCFPLIFGGMAYGVVAGVVWAWGQRLGRSKAWALSAAIGVAVVATIIVPKLARLTPWGWVGMVYPSQGSVPAAWPLVALGAMAFAGVIAVRPLLDGISTQDLVDQSKRWESASSAAISGDPSLALATFRPLPSVGRSWNAVLPCLPLGVVFWWRDFVGSCRTPVRFSVSMIGLIASGALLTAAVSQGNAGWVAGAAAALLSFASLGSLSDGLRHAAEAYGAPQLYGLSRSSLIRHHSSLPLSFAVLLMLAGSGIAVLCGSSSVGLFISPSVGVVVFLIRVFDSAKGPLSPALLTPIPTPVGDLSGTVVLAWEADAALLVIGTGALTVFSFNNGGPAAVVAAVSLTAVTAIVLSVRRFQCL